jgi:hypothetical protein
LPAKGDRVMLAIQFRLGNEGRRFDGWIVTPLLRAVFQREKALMKWRRDGASSWGYPVRMIANC